MYAAGTYAPEPEPERVIARVRKHGRSLTLPVVLLLALAPASGYFIGYFEQLWQNLLALVAAAALAFFGVLLPLVGWLTHRTTITTQRVIQRWGVATRHRTEIAYTRLHGVRTHRTLGQRIYSCGDLELEVEGGKSLVIESVPRVDAVADAIQHMIEENYRRRAPSPFAAQGFLSQGF